MIKEKLLLCKKKDASDGKIWYNQGKESRKRRFLPMTPQEKRKELLSATLLKKLERRHFEAYYCPTATEAIEKVLSLIPEGSSITWGGSMTIRDMGLTKAVKEGNYNVIDRDTAANPAEMREMMRQGLLCDYYLTSTNAISEDGVLVNIDGTGNRVRPSASGRTM